MRSSIWVKILTIGLALALSSCALIQAQRAAEQKKKQQFIHRVDIAHIWVTTGNPPAGKPYHVLGEIKYTEPFSPDAIDSGKMRNKLKAIAYKKWPDSIDAIINENSQVSADGSTVTVSAKGIEYDSTIDRTALHNMNNGMVASPSGD